MFSGNTYFGESSKKYRLIPQAHVFGGNRQHRTQLVRHQGLPKIWENLSCNCENIRFLKYQKYFIRNKDLLVKVCPSKKQCKIAYFEQFFRTCNILIRLGPDYAANTWLYSYWLYIAMYSWQYSKEQDNPYMMFKWWSVALTLGLVLEKIMSKYERLQKAYFSALGANLASATEVIKGRRTTQKKLKGQRRWFLWMHKTCTNEFHGRKKNGRWIFLKSIEFEVLKLHNKMSMGLELGQN